MRKQKNKYGQYFTRPEIAEFMVTLISHGRDAKILEPSCGKGVFLKALLANHFTRLSAYEIDDSLHAGFQFVEYASFISVPTTDKYDVIIGNPPYIRWKHLEEELKAELLRSTLWKEYFNSLCDYSFIFILKSIEHLTQNGELIFICPEYWMNTTNSKTLRNYMMQYGYISEIYHFKDAPLFEDVSSSLIIFRYVKSTSASSITFYQYTGKGYPNKEELFAKKCFSKKEIPQFKPNERWIFADEKVRTRLRDFENCCAIKQFDKGKSSLHRIGDYCDIGNGMVSGLDKAFHIGEVDQLQLNENERESLIRVYKAKDLTRFFNIHESAYFFIREDISENQFEKEYPYLFKLIQQYKPELARRYNYNKDIKEWEFTFPRNVNMFLRREKRIFVPCKERISNKKYFRFALADHNVFPLQDVTCIMKKENCKESVEYILAYLNSHFVFDWLLYHGINKGDVVEFSEAPIANIPYRSIDWTNPSEIAIHQTITDSVNSYISTKEAHYLSLIETNINSLFMNNINYREIIESLKAETVERPNKSDRGTLSGHAAGEPFEKSVYHKLKRLYPDKIFKQYEYLNDLYLRNPHNITAEQRRSLFDSPVVLFLLSRGDAATSKWNPANIFEEKQNDTADILYNDGKFFELIDVKTRNISKDAQAPNIISAYKLAKACAVMLDNEDFDSVNLNYIEVDWIDAGEVLKCVTAHYAELFRCTPATLYINWAAAMQIQFHVCNLDQTFEGSRREWAKEYLKVFVASAKSRCEKMYATYVVPFEKYLE